MPNDILHNDRPTKTDLHCTECHKGFIAELDFGLDGNHIIECPWCGHEHCRVITAGRVTEDRWSSRAQRPDGDLRALRVWKHDVLPMQTTSASHFIRQRWLDKLT